METKDQQHVSERICGVTSVVADQTTSWIPDRDLANFFNLPVELVSQIRSEKGFKGMQRDFVRSSEVVDGRRKSVIRLTCGTCGVVSKPFAAQTKGSTLPPEAIIRNFKAKSWQVGVSAKDDECPCCISRKQEARRNSSETIANEVAAMPNAAIATNSDKITHRKMEMSDRRIIIAKLTETYEDEVAGYRPGWTDAKVAADLGCSVDWVIEIRDANFGPVPENRAVQELIESVKRDQDNIDDIRERASALNKEIAALRERVIATSKKAEEIQRALR